MMKKKEQPSQSKSRRSVLGMGLDALFPDIGPVEVGSPRFLTCDPASIKPNRFQPRKRFSEEDLADLAESIRKQGMIQPLVVRPDGTGFELVAGERRLRAAALAGMTEVPAVVVDVSDEEMLLMAIVENVQREDLNPMEQAEGYHRLVSEFALTQEQVAERVGKKRPTVANFLRLMNLPSVIQESLREGALSMGHARALLGLESKPRLMLAYKTVLAKSLSVRATEELVDALKDVSPEKPEPAKPVSAVHLQNLAEELSRHLGAKVKIKRKGKKGTLAIEFYADEDLERLIAILKAN
ncbi:MAG: ParB/RepB/Spo0J family partition protein [Thermodesulfobacteriota bacterium]